MKSRLHGFSGAVALLCIATFWTSTVVSELFLDTASVVVVKNAVLTGMWVLIPAMAATGGSGFSLARSRSGRLVKTKGRRMKAVAANGLLVLLPSAWVLASWANAGRHRRRVLRTAGRGTGGRRDQHHAAHAEHARRLAAHGADVAGATLAGAARLTNDPGAARLTNDPAAARSMPTGSPEQLITKHGSGRYVYTG